MHIITLNTFGNNISISIYIYIYIYIYIEREREREWSLSRGLVIVAGNGHCDLSSIPGEMQTRVCIPYNINTLGKGMHPVILLPAMSK